MALSAGAAAQAPAPAVSAAPTAGVPGCTYDACALRRERILLSERLLAGFPGRVVARPRWFGALPAAEAVRAVPEAVPDARVYERESRLGRALGFVATAVTVVAVVDAYNHSRGCSDNGTVLLCGDRGFRDRQIALFAGGVVLGAVGSWRLQIADRRFNRAVATYNRALAAGPR